MVTKAAAIATGAYWIWTAREVVIGWRGCALHVKSVCGSHLLFAHLLQDGLVGGDLGAKGGQHAKPAAKQLVIYIAHSILYDARKQDARAVRTWMPGR